MQQQTGIAPGSASELYDMAEGEALPDKLRVLPSPLCATADGQACFVSRRSIFRHLLLHKSFSAVRIPCMGKASCNEGFVDGLNGTANHFLFRFIQYLWF